MDASNQQTTTRLSAQDLSLSYAGRVISQNLSLQVPDQQISVIIGPNGCGKSTLLRGMCNLLSPATGRVVLDGTDIAQLSARGLAQKVGWLPQSAQAPAGIRVADLVARGRYPHQGPFRQNSPEDERIVATAMQAAGVADLADQEVDALSGGQRQRVWIALVLAQETPILLLDEPTTFLDIAHQIELLTLLRKLNNENGRTIVAVLHDLNQACRYADNLIVMKDGQIVAEGAPGTLMSPELLQQVFGLDGIIIDDPISHTPMIVPR